MARLTHLGQQIALRGTGTGTNGGIYNYATYLRLLSGATTPAANGSGFTIITPGNGYASWTLSIVDWVFEVVNDNYRIRLTDRTVTASGVIADISGAVLMDASSQALAWWDRSRLTLRAGSTFTLDDLAITGG